MTLLKCYTVSMFSNPKVVVNALGITPGMIVADVGAGSGEYSIALARATSPSGRVYAIDVQKDLLTRIKNLAVKEGVGSVEVIWGDIEKQGGASLSDNSVDVAVVANMFFQVEDKRAAAQEIVRIVKPQGKIAIVDWEDSFGGLGPRPEDVVSADAAQKVLAEFGFKKVSDFNAGDHHYGLILKKSL